MNGSAANRIQHRFRLWTLSVIRVGLGGNESGEIHPDRRGEMRSGEVTGFVLGGMRIEWVFKYRISRVL
ncbi:hypothetical protein OU5_5200 [Pseudomonas mandelii JR-1]|uniref:Uncharacterized protein n=1 Tax=Pseudomonas mandelii JR-1 TaxID=1147786 RepID=A0A024EH90_9PSED|nr:hypothetical protein OU5_5200 [Pseudomonas mandelii JR-1]